MKPYFYILLVLLVGGSIGYFIGQRAGTPSDLAPKSSDSSSDDHATITALLDRQKEAFSAHDELLLFRDCAANYVEINADTGEVFDLQRAVVRHHEEFQPGKTINLGLGSLDIQVMRSAALARGTYSKTSDQFAEQGFSGLGGEVVWLLSKQGARWKIVASLWREEKKR
ncbi:MAG: hypothetical protein FJW26_12935 [Acidimicrobiia bacterium]|nr:hypothetical protein [Acidimicrobiia bacterium]